MRSTCLSLVATLTLGIAAIACSAWGAPPSSEAEVNLLATLSLTTTPHVTTGPLLPATTVAASFQRVSPASIVIDGATFEAFAFSRESCLMLDVQITSDREISSPPQDEAWTPITELGLLDGDTGAPLTFELKLGHGGGGGAPGGPFQLSQGFTYDVKSPLPLHRITAMVTFHQSLGIAEPVRFDVEVVARPTLYCPQLPPTTPEG